MFNPVNADTGKCGQGMWTMDSCFLFSQQIPVELANLANSDS